VSVKGLPAPLRVLGTDDPREAEDAGRPFARRRRRGPSRHSQRGDLSPAGRPPL